MKKFRVSKKSKISTYLFAIFWTGCFGWAIVEYLSPESSIEDSTGFAIGLSTFMVIVSIIMILDDIYDRVIVTEDTLIVKGLISHQEIKLDEIKGYKVLDDKSINIFPQDANRGKIKISSNIKKLD